MNNWRGNRINWKQHRMIRINCRYDFSWLEEPWTNKFCKINKVKPNLNYYWRSKFSYKYSSTSLFPARNKYFETHNRTIWSCENRQEAIGNWDLPIERPASQGDGAQWQADQTERRLGSEIDCEPGTPGTQAPCNATTSGPCTAWSTSHCRNKWTCNCARGIYNTC